MSTLKAIDGSELTEYVVRLLNNCRIVTVAEFMQENSVKLSKITNLSLRELVNVKKLLFREHGVPIVSGFQLYQDLRRNFSIVPTGIRSLDNILDGGLLTGNLIEITGLPAAGKTQLCNTIAINVSQNLDIESLYIDTKRDFSGIRVHNTLKSRGCSENEIGKIMKRIRVERLYAAQDLINLLKELQKCAKTGCKNLKIVFIDSLPSIWFLFYGDRHYEGIKLLVEATNLMRRLANENQLTIILVNIVTRWMELSLEENESTKSQTIKPSLGKYWQTVPSVRLLIEREEDNAATRLETTSKKLSTTAAAAESGIVATNDFGYQQNQTNHRSIKIIKSDLHATGKCCRVYLTEKGVITSTAASGGADERGGVNADGSVAAECSYLRVA